MKAGILATFFIAILWVSCRREVPNDFAYYQPYQRDTLLKKAYKTPENISEADSLKSIQKSNFPVNLNDKYFIVIASYTIEEYGLETLKEVKENGFYPELFMLNNDGWYKLAIESYHDIQKADSALNRIRQLGGYYSEARIVAK